MQPDDPTSGSPSSPPWKWWMPAGNYQLIEVIEVSEVNPGDPNYVPHHTFFSNPLQSYRLNPNQTLAFEFGSHPLWFSPADGLKAGLYVMVVKIHRLGREMYQVSLYLAVFDRPGPACDSTQR